jgi:hypothetical protein
MIGSLRRLRPGHHRREVDDLAVVFRLRLGPNLAHRLDLLAHPLEAGFEVGTVVLHLVLVPATADAEEEPPLRHLVERGGELGGLDRIALDDEADAGADLQCLGRGRRGGQDHERVHRVVIHFRHIAAAGEWRLAAQRDVRMLGRPQRLEPARLARVRQLDDRHRIIGVKHESAEIHAALPSMRQRTDRDCFVAALLATTS